MGNISANDMPYAFRPGLASGNGNCLWFNVKIYCRVTIHCNHPHLKLMPFRKSLGNRNSQPSLARSPATENEAVKRCSSSHWCMSEQVNSFEFEHIYWHISFKMSLRSLLLQQSKLIKSWNPWALQCCLETGKRARSWHRVNIIFFSWLVLCLAAAKSQGSFGRSGRLERKTLSQEELKIKSATETHQSKQSTRSTNKVRRYFLKMAEKRKRSLACSNSFTPLIQNLVGHAGLNTRYAFICCLNNFQGRACCFFGKTTTTTSVAWIKYRRFFGSLRPNFLSGHWRGLSFWTRGIFFCPLRRSLLKNLS